MTLIEGFGDEVVVVFVAFLVVIVTVLAWMSTQVDSRFLVPIIILDRERFSALMQRLRGIAEQRFSANGEQLHERPEGGESNSPEATAEGGLDCPPSASSETLEPRSEQAGPSVDLQVDSSSTQCQHDINDDSLRTDSAENLEAQSGVPGNVTEGSVDSMSSDRREELERPSLNRNQNPTEASEQSDDSSNLEGRIQIRLQYIDGRHRLVSAKPDDTVGEFKRNHFSEELAGHSIVRFVMSGQELRNDNSTLRSYRVSDGSVIHCLITQARVDPVVTSVDSHHFEIGVLMLPLFGFLLTLLWYARIAYRTYFSGASTCSLVAISFLYLIALFGSFRSNRLNHPHQE